MKDATSRAQTHFAHMLSGSGFNYLNFIVLVIVINYTTILLILLHGTSVKR